MTTHAPFSSKPRVTRVAGTWSVWLAFRPGGRTGSWHDAPSWRAAVDRALRWSATNR